jgi:hypothetical protein
MRRVRHAWILPGLLALLAPAGCHQIAVYTEHDSRVSFDGMHAYAWRSPEVRGIDGAEMDEETRTRIRTAVDAELASRGFERVDDAGPDFLVGCAAALRTDQRQATIDRYSGYRRSAYLDRAGTRDHPRSTARRQTSTYEYEDGSLILDIRLPESNRLAWRGYARTVFSPDDDAALREQRLREAIRRILADFPPKGG